MRQHVAQSTMGHYLLGTLRLDPCEGKALAGQFNWGGIHLITNQMGPKVGSVRSEIGRRVQRQKPA